MSSRIITSGDLVWIVNIMCQNTDLVRNRQRLVLALGLTMGTVTDIKRDIDNKTNTSAFLLTAMNLWISKSTDPTVERLVGHLAAQGFNSTADEIEAKQSECFPTPFLQNYNPDSSVWFDVPEDIHMFTGRAYDLGKLHASITKQNSENGVKDLTVITAVCGMGGIGKTSLTIHYAWKYFKNNFYKNVIWINSETRNSIYESFKRLAIKLGLNVSFQLVDIASDTYDYFKTTKTLFIFDNVESYSDLKPYIPKRMPKTIRPYVLVSSRNRGWNLRTHLIVLNIFGLKDSVEYYKKYLGLTTKEELSIAGKISKELGNLPLAIKQAGAYMKIQRLENKKPKPVIESLKEYQSLIKSNSTKILEFEHWSHTGDIYEKSVYTTWTLTMEKIRQQNETTERIIELISYLNPDKIPIRLLYSIPETGFWNRLWGNPVQACKIDDAVKLLTSFCLITVDNECYISVHRLLQKVIRDRLRSKYNGSNLDWVIRMMINPSRQPGDEEYNNICVRHAFTLEDRIESTEYLVTWFSPRPPKRLIEKLDKFLEYKTLLPRQEC